MCRVSSARRPRPRQFRWPGRPRHTVHEGTRRAHPDGGGHPCPTYMTTVRRSCCALRSDVGTGDRGTPWTVEEARRDGADGGGRNGGRLTELDRSSGRRPGIVGYSGSGGGVLWLLAEGRAKTPFTFSRRSGRWCARRNGSRIACGSCCRCRRACAPCANARDRRLWGGRGLARRVRTPAAGG